MAGLWGGQKGGGGGRIETTTTQMPSPMEAQIANYLSQMAPEIGKYMSKGLSQYPQASPNDLLDIRKGIAKTGGTGGINAANSYLNLYSKTMQPQKDIFELALKMFGAGQ